MSLGGLLRAVEQRQELRDQIKLFTQKLGYGAIDSLTIEMQPFMVGGGKRSAKHVRGQFGGFEAAPLGTSHPQQMLDVEKAMAIGQDS